MSDTANRMKSIWGGSSCLTAGQQYAIKSLSSVTTAAMPPWSASKVVRYANCASASYGATTNSTFSDRKIWKTKT